MSVYEDFEQRRAARLAAFHKKKQLAKAKKLLGGVLGMYSMKRTPRPVTMEWTRKLWTANWEATLARAKEARRRMNGGSDNE